VLVVDVDTARAHTDARTRLDYYARIVEAMAAVPGVERASASSITPFSGATRSPIFAQPGRVHEHAVTPGYFATYGISIREGRDFDSRDVAAAPGVAAVSESYARRFFPGGNALGRTITSSACDPKRGGCSVVAVIADAVFGPPRGGARPTIYVPLTQSAALLAPARTGISVSLRTAGASPVLLERTVSDALNRLHPHLAFSFRPLEQDINDTLIQERLVAALSTAFGLLGVLLSGLGLYGVTAYVTSRRRPEIGIRLALGATPAAVVRLMLSRIAMVIAAGIVCGGVVALWLSRFVAALLYDVQPGDPLTIASAAAVLIVVTGLAAWIPAFRASRIDPARVLREQ
jgi:putative ABC transport system permease protein